MHRAASDGARDPQICQLALQITQGAANKDNAGEIAAVYSWFIRSVAVWTEAQDDPSTQKTQGGVLGKLAGHRDKSDLQLDISGNTITSMRKYSSREAAEKLGISYTSLNRYIADGKIPLPPLMTLGAVKARLWSDKDIERVRLTLQRIANGRKTRHQKRRKSTKK